MLIGRLADPYTVAIVSVGSMRILAALALALVLAGAAQAARIVGTAGGDRLLGTSRADTILGGGGRDRLEGRCRHGLPARRRGAGSGRRGRGRGSRCRPVRRRRRPRPLRPGRGRRQRGSAGHRRLGLRGRQPPALSRPVHDDGGPARDAGRARQHHRRPHDRRDVPGWAKVRRRRGQHRLRRLDGRRTHVEERPAAEPDAGEPAGGAQRSRQRPRRRVRRRESRLADRDARPCRADDAAHRQPLDGRLHVERSGERGGGVRGERHRVRQELDRVRQRSREPVPGPLLHRVHGRAATGPARGGELDRRRADLVGAHGSPRARRGRRVPGAEAERRARRRLPPGRPAHRRLGLGGRRDDVRAARGRERGPGTARSQAPLLPAPLGRRRPGRARVGDVARLPLQRRLQREQRRRLHVGGRPHLDGAGRRHVGKERDAPGGRDPSGERACSVPLPRRAAGRRRRRAGGGGTGPATAGAARGVCRRRR